MKYNSHNHAKSLKIAERHNFKVDLRPYYSKLKIYPLEYSRSMYKEYICENRIEIALKLCLAAADL